MTTSAQGAFANSNPKFWIRVNVGTFLGWPSIFKKRVHDNNKPQAPIVSVFLVFLLP